MVGIVIAVVVGGGETEEKEAGAVVEEEGLGLEEAEALLLPPGKITIDAMALGERVSGEEVVVQAGGSSRVRVTSLLPWPCPLPLILV